MNPNIEIITPDLWGVNMDWVKAGYIEELRPLTDTFNQINLTNTGKIILDENSMAYQGLKKFFIKAMKFSDDELKKEFRKTGNMRGLHAGLDLWNNILGFELKRRSIKMKYEKRGLIEKAKKIGMFLLAKVGVYHGNDTIKH